MTITEPGAYPNLPAEHRATRMAVPMTVTGFHPGIPGAVYHADPGSLSHSGARLILDSPARYRWERDHPTPPTPAMEEGSALHALVLEDRAAHVVVDGGRGVTERKAEARAQGLIPLSADYCRLAKWRTNDRDQLAKVLGIAKAAGPTQDETLFDEVTA